MSLSVSIMSQRDAKILCWNIRGLNANVRKDATHDIIRDTHATIVCIQETKLAIVNDGIIQRALGPQFVSNYSFLPADGTRGGMIMAVSDAFFSMSEVSTSNNTVSATITLLADGTSWTMTGAYGPQSEQDKIAFLDEILQLQPLVRDRWILLGDFNLIVKAADKSNSRINRRLMGKFKTVIDSLMLKEMRLNGRRFTWSNEQQNPTHTKIDHVFCSNDWEMLFPAAHLQALPTMCSDHCPLFLQGDTTAPNANFFKFEQFWLKMHGFQETVQAAWTKQTLIVDPVRRLHTRLCRTAKALKKWQRESVGSVKLQIKIATEIIWRLDTAQESRGLSEAERTLRTNTKSKLLALYAIQKSLMRQRSRLTWIKKGDANTRLFHITASARRRKKFIQTLQKASGGVAISKEDKEAELLNHFQSHLGTPVPRSTCLNWEELGYTPYDLSALDAPFDEMEIKKAVFSLPSVKAPGPDGFIGAFFKSCWEIIKDDLTAAILHLASRNGDYANLINSANIVLLPKSVDAQSVGDFRPISLIHSISKIFSKLLANRVAPVLGNIVSKSQSAFIQKRCIHDNFLHVQNLIKALHKKKTPSLFLKLDISKAFDSINWPYLLEVLQALGFGQNMRDWISLTLSSSTSRVLLNGIPGPPFHHAKGLRQGDPFSPMLFILAIDPLQRILHMATDMGVLKPVQARTARLRTSLYADDAGIFANPDKEELLAIRHILDVFADATGLRTNLDKTEVFPIRCEGVDLADALSAFPAKLATFPGRYLGLPLHIRRLRKVDLQPLIDKYGARIPGWRGRNLTRAGRVSLSKTVLTPTVTYHSTVIPLPKWAVRKLDKLARNFIWNADDSENANGGRSLVNWKVVCTPKNLGGLGVVDLDRFGRALRLRWPWYEWMDPDRPWVGTELPCSDSDMALFRASTTITIGDGKRTSFWKDRWIGDSPLCVRAPQLYKIATRKNRTVFEDLEGDRWITAISRLSNADQLREFIDIWQLLQDPGIDPSRPDSIRWNWTNSGEYSSKSAYQMQFVGRFMPFRSTKVWKAQTTPKCKLFAWLVLHGRILTAENLAIRGWPHNPICRLCLTSVETVAHLCRDCPFSQEVWRTVNAAEGMTNPSPPNTDSSINLWWEEYLATASGRSMRERSGIMIYSLWNIWKERNRRVFTGNRMTYREVANLALADIRLHKSSCFLYRE
jgi:exonuclease III